MSTIILSTINARYIHSALGLRYLFANMTPEMRASTSLLEFVIDNKPIDIAEKILEKKPKIVGFGVYIWNAEQTQQVIAILKNVDPTITVILGGPEVSYQDDFPAVVELADYVICGQADRAFQAVCASLLEDSQQTPGCKVVVAPVPALEQLALPYAYYDDQDISNRVIYVEASRGCPFKCEFCLSALDKTAWPFPLDNFLLELDKLYQRGARSFKFVDRTFNLKIDSSIRILEFFLTRLDEKLFLHFELIPDHLPKRLQDIIVKFPPGTIQFEIGIQTFNPTVQTLISRKQDQAKTEENIRWLRLHSGAHLHTDLIVGLPGESLESIEQSFNRLLALEPHEIQVGILKRLRGTPLIRHTASFSMRYNPHPPYNILSNSLIDFHTLQRLSRFARYWDMIGNSGRFSATRSILLGDSPFKNFMKLSDWLFEETGQTHRIALPRLFDLVHRGISATQHMSQDKLETALLQDYSRSGIKGRPAFILDSRDGDFHDTTPRTGKQVARRQSRHS